MNERLIKAYIYKEMYNFYCACGMDNRVAAIINKNNWITYGIIFENSFVGDDDEECSNILKKWIKTQLIGNYIIIEQNIEGMFLLLIENNTDAMMVKLTWT